MNLHHHRQIGDWTNQQWQHQPLAFCRFEHIETMSPMFVSDCIAEQRSNQQLVRRLRPHQTRRRQCGGKDAGLDALGDIPNLMHRDAGRQMASNRLRQFQREDGRLMSDRSQRRSAFQNIRPHTPGARIWKFEGKKGDSHDDVEDTRRIGTLGALASTPLSTRTRS
jgi:hypothetical protein